MRAKGTVKWFNDAKGFGFITPEAGGPDIFVHFTGIRGKGRRTLTDDAKVEYEVIEGQRGPQAVEVQPT